MESLETNEAWLSLLQGSKRDGDYVYGYVDGRESYDSLLSVFINATHSSFRVQQSLSAFTQAPAEVLRGLPKATSLRLKWSKTAGELPVEFDGTPFIVCGRTMRQECIKGARVRVGRSGADDGGEEENKVRVSQKRKFVQRSRTEECGAHLKALRVLRFPELSIDVSGAAFALRRRKEDVAARAMRYFEGEPVVVERFYVALPTIAAHNGHLPQYATWHCSGTP